MSSNKTFINVVAGTKKREDLFLPILYFPTVDPFLNGKDGKAKSWVEELGPKTFIAWLQLHTLVDRSKEADMKYGNEFTIPNSIEGLAKVLGVSKSTFYRNVIKPLWNYGLIDLEEWRDQKKIGTKAMNIIVYPYPQNNKDLENKPLIKVRDYDTEYNSEAKSYAKKASYVRKKESDLHQQETPSTPSKEDSPLADILVYLQGKGISQEVIKDIESKLEPYANVEIPLIEVDYQLEHMRLSMEAGNTIYDFAEYFIKGLMMRMQSQDNLKALNENNVTITANERSSSPIFYNWLEEREGN